MAINYPGPYEIEMEYLVSSMTHKLRFSCTVDGTPSPGTPSNTINILKRGGALASMDSVVGQFWGFLRPWFHTGVTVNQVTLWKYTTGTFERTYIATMGVSLAAGSSATAPSLATQNTFTFRSGNGGIAKITLLEGNDPGALRYPLIANSAGDIAQKLAAYLISSDSPVLARDDSFLVAPMYRLGGQNEALFRKRYRV